MKYADDDIVTEPKLVWFLREYVLDREIRRSRYQKERTTADGQRVRQTLGKSSVKLYVAAIVDLWSEQKTLGLNGHPNPRGKAVQALIHNHARQEHIRKREQFQDRAAGTLLDGYDEDKMVDVVRYCWQQNATGRGQRVKNIEARLRTGLDFLLSHNMLLRSEARRKAEHPDLFTLSLPNEGPTACHAMILVLDNGKTNQFGRLEYGAVFRHRNPLLCTMSHLAYYLFFRWNILKEPPPKFQQRQQWYNLKLLQGEKKENPMAYETQLHWTSQAFDAANLQCLKKTHAGRAEGAKHASLHGVSEGQIRRAGRWNSDALTSCYLTDIPRKFARTMAGFNASGQGNYYLPRAQVVPPPALERALWPWVDVWFDWFSSGEGQIEQSEMAVYPATEYGPQTMRRAEEDRRDLAAQGHLRLLKELRPIILQDSIILKEEFPDHPIWTDEVFAREDYKVFAQEVALALESTEEPEEIQLRRAVPLIAERLNIVQQANTHSANEWGAKILRAVGEANNKIDDLVSGRVPFLVRAYPPGSDEATVGNLVAPLPPLSSSAPPLPSSAPFLPPSLLPPLTSSSSSSDPIFSSLSASLDLLSSTSRTTAPDIISTAVPAASTVVSSITQYELSRTIQTVPDLWREWTVGLTGYPAVQMLEDTHGPSWRTSQKERMLFSRRKKIIDEIRKRQAEGKSIQTAVEEVELVRSRGRMSLHKLSEVLRQPGRV